MRLFIFALFLLTFLGCAKEPGFGGNAAIIGKLKVDNYNYNYSILKNSYYPPNEYIYILFGDNPSYGDRVRTHLDGSFEFNNLHTGHYTIYAYSKDSSNSSPSGYIPIMKSVEVNTAYDLVDIGELVTFDNDIDGYATIKGKVTAYDNGVPYYVPDERVFIVYDDDYTLETSQRTKYDGSYEFKNLPLGKFEIYAYTDDNQNPAGISPVIIDTVINTTNQIITLPDLIINP